MAVMQTLFKWEDVYYLTFKELPDAGLIKLRNELAQKAAISGINFEADLSILLDDVEREVKRRRAAQN